jgi:hypothetical protein
MLRRLRFTWDAVANSWNQWVLGYTPERQMQLLRRLGFESATWQTLTILLMTACSLVIAVVALRVLSELRLAPGIRSRAAGVASAASSPSAVRLDSRSRDRATLLVAPPPSNPRSHNRSWRSAICMLSFGMRRQARPRRGADFESWCACSKSVLCNYSSTSRLMPLRLKMRRRLESASS